MRRTPCAAQAEPDGVGAPRSVRARLGKEGITRLVEQYKSGIATTRLMVDFGLSKTAVLGVLRDAGITPRRQPLTKAQIQRAAEMYTSGNTLAATAAQLGLARESVRRALVDAGVAMRPRGGHR